jgi:hypothetical protein
VSVCRSPTTSDASQKKNLFGNLGKLFLRLIADLQYCLHIRHCWLSCDGLGSTYHILQYSINQLIEVYRPLHIFRQTLFFSYFFTADYSTIFSNTCFFFLRFSTIKEICASCWRNASKRVWKFTISTQWDRCPEVKSFSLPFWVLRGKNKNGQSELQFLKYYNMTGTAVMSRPRFHTKNFIHGATSVWCK